MQGYVRVGRHQPARRPQYVISYLRTGPIADESRTGESVGHGARRRRQRDRRATRRQADGCHRRQCGLRRRTTLSAYGTALLQALAPGSALPVPEVALRRRGHAPLLRRATSRTPSSSTSSLARARPLMPSRGSTGRTAAAGSRSSSPTTRCPPTRRRRCASRASGRATPSGRRSASSSTSRGRGSTAAITGRDAGRRADQGRLQVHRRVPDGRRLRGERRVPGADATSTPTTSSSDLAFDDIAPLLWLRAGAQGPIVDERVDAAGRRMPYAWTERYGVLFDADRWRAFVEQPGPRRRRPRFIVTDSPATFAGHRRRAARRTSTSSACTRTYLSMFLHRRGARLMRYELTRLPARRRHRGAQAAPAGARRLAEDGDRSSFALSAITGSGKTVIATAVIEATAVRVDRPRRRPRPAGRRSCGSPTTRRSTARPATGCSTPRSCSPRGRCVEVDEAFLDADLAPGRVYFLNTQKLSKTSRLSQSGTNAARSSRSGTSSRNTIRGEHDRPRTWSSTRPTGA